MRNETTRERLWQIRQTEKAIQFSTMPQEDVTARRVWIPRSALHHVSREAPLANGWVPCTVEMDLWIAEREKL